MTPARSGSFIRRAKDITISSTLALAILATGMIMPACSNSEDDEGDYSYEETTYAKGIRSYIKETKPGEFEITDEESVDTDKSAAIVTYLDGRTETLTPEAAKTLIDADINDTADSTRTNNTHQNGYHRRSGLSSVLLYGGMGYMLGRRNSYINSYREGTPGSRSAYYSSPGVYQKAQSAHNTVQASRSTRTVTTRPSGGKSGFFGRSSSKSGG